MGTYFQALRLEKSHQTLKNLTCNKCTLVIYLVTQVGEDGWDVLALK